MPLPVNTLALVYLHTCLSLNFGTLAIWLSIFLGNIKRFAFSNLLFTFVTTVYY